MRGLAPREPHVNSRRVLSAAHVTISRRKSVQVSYDVPLSIFGIAILYAGLQEFKTASMQSSLKHFWLLVHTVCLSLPRWVAHASCFPPNSVLPLNRWQILPAQNHAANLLVRIHRKGTVQYRTSSLVQHLQKKIWEFFFARNLGINSSCKAVNEDDKGSTPQIN